ncbi:MAG TPA: glutamate--tRNA ligase, partial [Anaerolineales bacterium]|nr:glutamate--tRNA ligase [Anaerolineales bacterium]
MAKALGPARVRVAPSPTGHMHLATARTALYDYLLARQTGGQFVLRIEDTDLRRTVPGSEQEIMDGLRWLGLEYDEGPDVGGPYGPYRQTERRDLYTQHAEILLDRGMAYPCFCTPERLEQMRQEQQRLKQPTQYDGLCRRLDPDEARRRVNQGERHVIRFKMPREGTTTATDLLRGDIVIENKNIDDYVILKSDGLPTYHLAAMVDDHEMKITHVLRGAEWLSTFPLHVNVIRAFGWDEPTWVHLSLFLKPSGKGKLSKRDAAEAIKDGYSVFVKDLQDLGFIPEGVLNWIVLMGWGVADDDVLTLADMTRRFDLSRLTASPAAINFTKLDHFNATHIRMLSDEDFARRTKPFFTALGLPAEDAALQRIAPLIKPRLTTLDDAPSMAGFFFRDGVTPARADLTPKGMSEADATAILQAAVGVLESTHDFRAESLDVLLRGFVDRVGRSAGEVFGILRVAVTGQKVSPPLF